MTISEIWRSMTSTPRATALEQLSQTAALQLSNQLNGVGCEGVDLPRIVVVGMQSSGKSSLLNAIMGMSLMPTGGAMVTRVPLDLRLERDETLASTCLAEFGRTDAGGQWRPTETVELDTPQPSAAQVDRLRQHIEQETERVAGAQKGISSRSIHLRLRASHLPNLSVVDLPGLTMVACTDQGQPSDIKDQIRALVKEWASPARTIIACVMPARTDLEADAALDLAKEINPTGDRIVGVITKPDLMGKRDDVTKYLLGRVSRDLQLGLGYYCIRGRSTEPTLSEAEAASDAYFQSPPYDQVGIIERCGTSCLTKALAAALADYVRRHLPQVVDELKTMQATAHDERTRLGDPPPSDATERRRVLQSGLVTVVSESCEDLDRGSAGCDLRTRFEAFRRTIQATELVRAESSRLLVEMRGVQGNHLSNGQGCPIHALEALFLDRPSLFAPWRAAAIQLASETVQIIHASLAFPPGWHERFPSLVKKLHLHVASELLSTASYVEALDGLIERETSYFWTDDPSFRSQLAEPAAKPHDLLHAYTGFVADVFGNAVPKLVMARIVRPYLRTVGLVVVQAHSTLIDCFREPCATSAKRAAVETKHQQLTTMLVLCEALRTERPSRALESPVRVADFVE